MSVRLKKIFFYGFLIFLIFLIVSPFLISLAINSNPVKNKVASFIAEKTHQKIEIKDFSIVFFPKPGLKINGLNYTHADLSLVRIRAVTITFNAIKLLLGKFIIEQVRLDNPVVNFSQVIKGSNKKAALGFDISKVFDLKNLFSYLPDSQNHLKIIVNNLVGSYFKRLDGSILLLKNESKIIFNTSIDKIKVHTSDIDPVISTSFFNFQTIEIDKLNLFATLDTTLGINGRCVFDTLKIKKDTDTIIFNTNRFETVFKLKDGSYRLEIPSFSTQIPHANLGIRFQSRNDNSFIRFTGSDIDLKQARRFALTFIAKNNVTDTLFEIIQDGTSPRIEVSFENKELSKLFDTKNLILDGVIKNGVVNIPKTQLTVSKVIGRASIKNGALEIKTTEGLVQQATIKNGYFNIDLLNYNDYPFHGKFLLDIDLSSIPKTLIALLPDTVLAGELKRVRDVTGRCTATLVLQLPTSTPALIVKVSTEDFSTTGRYDRIPDTILIENILFKYEPDIITLENVRGQINGNSIIDLNTTINLKDKISIEALSGTALISLKKTIPWLRSFKKTREMISPVVDGTGILSIKHINLAGPALNPEKWKFNALGSGEKIDLTTRHDKKEITNLSFTYDLKTNEFKLGNINMASNSFSWLDAELKPDYIDAFSFPSLQNGHFLSGKSGCSFNGTLKFQGNAAISFDLQGKKYSSMTLKSVSIKDPDLSKATLSFIGKNKSYPINFKGKIDTRTIKKIFNPESVLAKNIYEITKGEPLSIQSDKTSQIKIHTKYLDLNALRSYLESSSIKKSSFPKTTILFQADAIKYNALNFKAIDSKILLSPNNLYIRVNSGRLCDLKTTGYITLKDNNMFTSFPFAAKDKENIQDLLSCILQKENFMNGQYSLTSNISSTGTPENIKKNFKGRLEFIAREGRIYKLTLLSRILSILNVSKVFKGKIPDITQKGFAYKNIIFKADIKDSVIYLEKAIIDGADMTLIFKGTIDPLNDKINITCLVSPFKTVDLIIEKIPIINTLLNGRLVSVPVQAIGKLSDPTVIPLHPSAVGKGLVDMMTDILKTPIKLLDKLTNESSKP
ncbi:MAG: AsmA-like C-terminal domain-containing protein [Desulfobacula sp.]|nr:AsmA-like C-terminal domain-containing protein [Desulfobacula sp.]